MLLSFKEFMNELTLHKFKALINAETDDDVVSKFKEIFSYDEPINIVKIDIGAKADKYGNVEYADRGTLIHELFHLLQFKAAKERNNLENLFSKYVEPNISDVDKFNCYILQPMELNNQALSLAININDNKIKFDDLLVDIDVKSLNLETRIDRLKYVFYSLKHANKSSAKYRDKLFKLVKTYLEYLRYANNANLAEDINKYGSKYIFGPTFI